jgi:hypothetical protein
MTDTRRPERGEGSVAIARRLAVAIFITAVALAAAPGSALSQTSATTGDLSGLVFDQSGAVLPGATVTAKSTDTAFERAVVSDAAGRYAIPALPPGLYSVTATLKGFAPERVDNVAVALGETARLSMTLRIAATEEQVTVVGAPASAGIGQTAVATAVSERQIETLPTNGRNFVAFSLITPFANTDRTPKQGASSSSGLIFAGQRGRSNNITVDGLDNNDSMTGSVRATFSQEAVQEFQVVANSYSAEFGKALGGVVNIITRSGGNRLAGNAFYYFRDEALNAKEHFEEFDPAGHPLNQAKAPYSQSQFGGTLGGPIRRDQSFFFLGAERLRVRANNFVNIDDTTPVIAGGTNYGTLVDILEREGFPIAIGHVPYRVESDQILAKVDTTLTQAHRLSVRFNWADLLDENAEPWGGLVAHSAGAYLDSRDLMGGASLSSSFSSRFLNELRFLVANREQTVMSFDPVCSGACDQNDEGGPALALGAILAGRQPMTPQPRDTRRYQVVDTLTRIAGRHGLKAGIDVSYLDVRSLSLPQAFGGRYLFTTNQALALGRPFAYVQGYGNPSEAGVTTDLSLFAEDEWRAWERLTLKLGVRYQNQFWPQMTGHGGKPPYDWPADNNNVAPRLAASWSPFKNNKTSVESTYGVFYDNHIAAIWGVPALITGTADHERIRIVPAPGSWAAWNTPGRKLPEPTTPYPSVSVTLDPRLKTPYAHHASVGLDHRLTGGLTLSARFVYVRGVDQVGTIEYNPVINASGSRPQDVNGPGTSASVSQYTSWADSWYRGLTLSVRKRFGGRSEFLALYTLSKAEDLATDYAFSLPQDNGFGPNPADPAGLPLGFNPMLERGLSLQDQRHRFVLSGSYLARWGITFSGIVTIGSGRPYNITAGTDLNGDGDKQWDRPWRVKNDLTTRIGRNTGLLSGTSSVDLRVAKQLVLHRRVKLDLMVEMFNLLNHTNYTQVDSVFGQGAYPAEPLPTFGQFTTAAPPFQVQLAARVSF